ncbi:MAG: hypothetical protein AABZ77_03465, partial [Chloroflexota bacterium]
MKPIIVLGLLVVLLLIGGCASGLDFDARLNSVVQPYRFSIAGWEWQTLVQPVKQWYWGIPIKQAKIVGDVGLVTRYFDAVKRIKTLQ